MTAGEENGDPVTPSRHAAPDTSPENQAIRPAVPGTTQPDRAEPGRRRIHGLPSGFTSLRDLLSFISGVGIIAHEVWWASGGHPQVAILTVGVALAGLPVVFGADEKRKPPSP